MPYKIKTVTTKESADVPDFDVWLEDLDPAILAEYGSTESSATNLITNDATNYSHRPGLISTNSYVSDDGLSWTWEEIWESQDACIEAHAPVTTNDNGELIARSKTPADLIKELYYQTYSFTETVFESNI